MRWLIFLLLLLPMALPNLAADLTTTPVADQTIPIVNQTKFNPQPTPEVSPALVGNVAYVSTDFSYRCHWTPGGLVCVDLITHKDPNVLWRRNYAGVYGAAEVGSHVLWFIHGENKNEVINGHKWVNTVNHDQTCFSGTQNGVYRDCWADYFGFISAARDTKDLGPIIFPKNGYLNARDKLASNGVRHPVSFKANGYVYVFYCDTSFNAIAVARSPAKKLAAQGSFETWSGKAWVPSLPHGTNLHKPGPNAHPILPGNIYFFSVTQVGKQYLGLGYGSPSATTFGTTVWTSSDLIHWKQDGHPIWVSKGTDTSSAFDASTVRYPRPLSRHLAIATYNNQIKLVNF